MSSRAPKKNDPEQFDMTWLFPHVKEILRVDEVARALAISESQVHVYLDKGIFLSASASDSSTGNRQHRRILRFSVEAKVLNDLEDQGIEPPVRQNNQVIWWRGELRKMQLAEKQLAEKEGKQ